MTTGSPRAGYALPAVLGVVSVLALVFASAASAVASLGARARAAVDGAGFQQAAFSAEAQALFLTATSPFAPDGLAVGAAPAAPGAARPRSPLRLDGRAYVWGPSPGLRVGLQDEAGLLNLDSSRPDTLLRLFARLGLTAVESETLRDRLLDALDADDDRRPRGAERAEYAAAGLPRPLPGGFADLAEVGGVLGWPALITGERRRALEAWTTAAPGSNAFNVNTAPAAVLSLVLNRSDEGARLLVALRERAPVTSLAQFGLPPADFGASAQPVRPSGRVRLTVEDGRRGLRYTSRLSPLDAPSGPPWTATGGALTRMDPAAPPDAPLLPDPAGPSAPR